MYLAIKKIGTGRKRLGYMLEIIGKKLFLKHFK